MKNQKGFAPILLIVVSVVVAAGIGYLVVSAGKSGGTKLLPKVQLPGITTLNPTCKLKDPELCRYINRAAQMGSSFEKGFSGKSVMTPKNGKTTESVWEMQGDKSHFQSLTDGKEEANIIVIGNTTYTKDMVDGKWFKYTAKESGQSSSSPGLFDVNQIKNTVTDTVKEMEESTTYQAMGKAPCGTMTCFKYQIVNTQLPDSKEYLYFDDREYLMRMMEVVGSVGTTTTTFTYSAVAISEPGPVKADDRFNLYDPSVIEKTSGSMSSVDMNELKQNLEEMMKNNSQIPSEEGSEAGGE